MDACFRVGRGSPSLARPPFSTSSTDKPRAANLSRQQAVRRQARDARRSPHRRSRRSANAPARIAPGIIESPQRTSTRSSSPADRPRRSRSRCRAHAHRAPPPRRSQCRRGSA
jgi:hypothetical protein